MTKSAIAKWLVSLTDDWNSAIHQAIEEKVSAKYPNAEFDPTGTVERNRDRARDFYYGRMSNTAMLLIAIASLVVSAIALLVAIVALMPSHISVH
jgi:hypothetical protein